MTTISIMTAEEFERCQVREHAGFGALATPRGVLPLQALDVQARIDGLLAQLTVQQTFVNVFDEPLEATYIFPLPDRAAVTGFKMEVAGRVIDGTLKERGAARRDYDAAIKAGHRAAIAEEERPDVFTLRVGNLLPREQATITLTLVGPLELADNEATFRFPLVVAPRYIPGMPLPGAAVGGGVADDTSAVPDASRITPPVLLPGFPNPVRLSLDVDVHAGGLKLSTPRCSLHTMVLADAEPGVQRLRLQPGERLDRDFILRFQVGSDSVDSSLSLAADEDGKQGTFLLTLVPPAAAAALQRPRDVVFLLDRSGSMAGWKMVAARRALGRMVDTLGERDRFNVLAFDDRVETPPVSNGTVLISGSDRHRFRAIEFLSRVDQRGGTELAQPLALALKMLDGRDASRERILILVTDGQVGNEDQLLKLVGPHLAGLRVFTLGIDQAVNAGFLKRLAQLGGGACELVESEDRLDEVMTRVHRRIAAPVVSDLAVQAGSLRFEARELTPARLPDLFAGAPVCILGRYQGTVEQQPTLTVSGTNAAGAVWSQTLVGQPGAGKALAATWARGRIRDLEDQYAIAAHRDVERQIVELSLGHSVLSRFTAYVAVDRAAVVNAGGSQHQVTQPVELPAGWERPQQKEAEYLCSLIGAAMSAMALRDMTTSELRAADRLADLEEAGPEAFRAPPSPRAARAPVEGGARRKERRLPDNAKQRRLPGKDVAVGDFIQQLIDEALAQNASEIRLVPEANRARVFLQIEQASQAWLPLRLLQPLVRWFKGVKDELTLNLFAQVVQRLKSMAGLDPKTVGVVQTGRIDVSRPGLPVWLELTVTPTEHGETVVLKVSGPARERFWA